MYKRKLFLDFDDTIAHSSKAICDTYNQIYSSHPNFAPANWWENTEWNFTTICPLIERPSDLFSDERFFDNLDFMNDNTKEVIENLCNKYEVIIASIGTPENIAYKSLWLKTFLPCIKEYHFLCNNHCKMDKSAIDMSGAIFIDDVLSNLRSSNAEFKDIWRSIFMEHDR
jgi:5'(3')-deoxyribonucleotidase